MSSILKQYIMKTVKKGVLSSLLITHCTNSHFISCFIRAFKIITRKNGFGTMVMIYLIYFVHVVDFDCDRV